MKETRQKSAKRRHVRIRKKIKGTNERPRLFIKKTLNHLHIQVIDDDAGKTLLGVSSSSKDVRARVSRGNVEGAKTLGAIVAERAKAHNINKIVFDRGGSVYHGRIKAFAEAVREAGLEF